MLDIPDLSAAEVRDLVSRSASPVLVDFWAPWCAPCKVLAPQVARVAAENDGALLVVKVNADEHVDFCRELGISGLPALVVFSGGQEVARKAGAAGGYGALKQLVAPFVPG